MCYDRKNESLPKIVVTVDLLTTGIDVPEVTTLVFMRRIKSRILFEQMLGRATRLCPSIGKTHFEIYDPVESYLLKTRVLSVKNISANYPKLVSHEMVICFLLLLVLMGFRSW